MKKKEDEEYEKAEEEKRARNAFKITYKEIAAAIYKQASATKQDVRNLIREWIRLFEINGVKNWNRDDFLDACAEEQFKRQQEEQ